MKAEKGCQSRATLKLKAEQDKSRYIALAQKLAEHLDSLPSDPNTRIRWIW